MFHSVQGVTKKRKNETRSVSNVHVNLLCIAPSQIFLICFSRLLSSIKSIQWDWDRKSRRLSQATLHIWTENYASWYWHHFTVSPTMRRDHEPVRGTRMERHSNWFGGKVPGPREAHHNCVNGSLENAKYWIFGQRKGYKHADDKAFFIPFAIKRHSDAHQDLSFRFFLLLLQRLNVLLTRAKCLLIIIGDAKMLAADKYWKYVIEYCKANDSLISWKTAGSCPSSGSNTNAMYFAHFYWE